MTRAGDTFEIIGKNALIGDLVSETHHERAKAAASKTQATNLQSQLSTEKAKASIARTELLKEKQENERLTQALAQKDALLKEWMHSNEAFKRLARKYGKKLGVSDEQRQIDLDDCVIESAEEKPEFQETKVYKETINVRGKR